ncbi:glycine receptor subunit alpha-4-like isoform X2 [Symsagittifera roscoffensis]|uniref:glycine receptor subunit alpha-4-like isoform X2 n=1 Tax=Symsagittifera roscoffensis TaxID=84072 RepID=UPI00307BAE67
MVSKFTYTFELLILRLIISISEVALRLCSFCGQLRQNIRPSASEGLQDNVNFDCFVHKMGPVVEKDMRMSVDIYFRQYWRDHRLVDLYTQVATSPNISQGSPIPLGRDYNDLIWFPDIYWVDALDVSKPGILSRSQTLELEEDSNIFFSNRLLVTFRCEMDLKYFPFDIQQCQLCFESYLYHMGHQNMSWIHDVISMTPGQKIANFYIRENPRTYTKETTYNLGTVWKQLCMEVHLHRKLAIYIITMFMPSISLVLLSWVGFWVDKKAIPARSGLSITTILATITLINGTGNRFPGVADLKMGDLYLIINFFYVFATLVEFALVSYQPPPRKKWKRARKNRFMHRMKGFAKIPKLVKGPTKVDEGTKIVTQEIDIVTRPKMALLFGAQSTLTNQNLKDETCVENDGTQLTPMQKEDPSQKTEANVVQNIQSQRENISYGKHVEFSTDMKENELDKVTKFDYWSSGNADEICKWLFPSSFLIWNLVYFFIVMKVSGRL